MIKGLALIMCPYLSFEILIFDIWPSMLLDLEIRVVVIDQSFRVVGTVVLVWGLVGSLVSF